MAATKMRRAVRMVAAGGGWTTLVRQLQSPQTSVCIERDEAALCPVRCVQYLRERYSEVVMGKREGVEVNRLLGESRGGEEGGIPNTFGSAGGRRWRIVPSLLAPAVCRDPLVLHLHHPLRPFASSTTTTSTSNNLVPGILCTWYEHKMAPYLGLSLPARFRSLPLPFLHSNLIIQSGRQSTHAS